MPAVAAEDVGLAGDRYINISLGAYPSAHMRIQTDRSQKKSADARALALASLRTR